MLTKQAKCCKMRVEMVCYKQIECAGDIDLPKLTDKDISKINSVLAKDDRAEVIPTKDGVKVVHIKRQLVK